MVRPIFVDHSGRRRRAVMILGSGLGVLLVVGLIMLTAGLLTGSPVPLPGWPEAVHGGGGNTVATEPTVAPAPTAPTTTRTTPVTTPTTAVPTGPGNGNGSGNGTSHRPTKTPGKP